VLIAKATAHAVTLAQAQASVPRQHRTVAAMKTPLTDVVNSGHVLVHNGKRTSKESTTMNIGITRKRLCLLVLGSALGATGLAQAGTVEQSKAEAPSVVAPLKQLDEAQMARESAGAYSRGCSKIYNCRG
jgi:hypothetical protein